MIVYIDGPKSEFRDTLAEAIRNRQISFGKGGLLIKEGMEDHDPKIMLEKIIKEVKFPDIVPDDWEEKIPFKPDSVIVFVGNGKKFLPKFEELLPDFVNKFGPIHTIDVTGPVWAIKK